MCIVSVLRIGRTEGSADAFRLEDVLCAVVAVECAGGHCCVHCWHMAEEVAGADCLYLRCEDVVEFQTWKSGNLHTGLGDGSL